MIKRLLKLFGAGLRQTEQHLAPATPLVSEHSTVMDEGVRLEDRLSSVIDAWEKRTGHCFQRITEGGNEPGEWGLPLLHNGALFFGSREYEAYRIKDAKQDVVKKKVMCKALNIWCKEVTYWLDGKEYNRSFENEEQANIFAIRVLAARKSIYTHPDEIN